MTRVQKPRELLRDLQARGVVVVRQKGSHIRLQKGDRFATLPMHDKDMKIGTRRSILRQLDIDDWL